jgi:hypothetical protein
MARLSRYLYLSIVSTHLVEVRGGQRASGWISDVPSAVQFSPAWRLHSVASLARTAAVPLPYLYFRRHFICGNARAATRRERVPRLQLYLPPESGLLLPKNSSSIKNDEITLSEKKRSVKAQHVGRGSSGDLQFCICS